ncbi:Mur ligase family protein [Comamonas sp. Y6]|uniref:Mur ligase family protein n=1 Tax=Comamonas resistens TaxID=3046670 RepID=A0ABY8SS31_9BURK|nr:Mur ligase family protein [Comamonas resistens]MDL5035892.1 Mur ligase family protein [Comamonas resistens]WHS65296.1 Mur ligase family protein [Comamonas resistens]
MLHSHGSPAAYAHAKDNSAAMEPETTLFRQLSQGLEYLKQHLTPLPQPFPGCLLFFSVAAPGQAAAVFQVRAGTLQAAWREGSTRIRQWAWAHKKNAVELRIDWVQDIIHIAAAPANWASNPATSWALADAELEHIALFLPLLGADQASAAPAKPALLLNLQGIYIDRHEAGIVVPRHPSSWSLPSHWCATHGPLRPVLHALLQQQQEDGSWPDANTAAKHLGLTYALLQTQRQGHHPDLGHAIRKAMAFIEAGLPHLAKDGVLQSAALLVLARHLNQYRPLATPTPDTSGPLFQHMEQLAQHLLASLQSALPAATLAWTHLALTAFARCNMPSKNSEVHNAAQLWHGQHNFQRCTRVGFGVQHHSLASQPWPEIAMLEASLLPMAPPAADQSAASSQWNAELQTLLQRLQKCMLLPEQALYLPPAIRQQAAFFSTRPRQPSRFLPAVPPALAGLCEAAQLLIRGLAATEHLMHSPAAAQPPASPQQAPGAHSRPSKPPAALVQRPLFQAKSPTAEAPLACTPMFWSRDELAALMGGNWSGPPLEPSAGCTGLDIHRQHHHSGAAVLVRRPGLATGISPAALHAVKASALISDSAHDLLRHGVPILQVRNLQQGLLNLAQAARRRIQAPIIAVTGHAGKSSVLSMLRHCLQQQASLRSNALQTQSAALQMINWSEASTHALIELSFDKLSSELPLAKPDILIVTGSRHEDDQAAKSRIAPNHTVLLTAIHLLTPGATLILDQTTGCHTDVIEAAQRVAIKVITFGKAPHIHTQRLTTSHGEPSIAMDEVPMTLRLQADGRHMAANALAALAALSALGQSPTTLQSRLESWEPLPGTGQPQLLPNGIQLLDHSQSSHIHSIQAAFTQLQTLTRRRHNRVIVLAGIQAHDQNLETTQLALAPLIRATPAKSVLLYGDALYPLSSTLGDLPHVIWHDDLNQLIHLLMVTAHIGDTVLLAGKATINLLIAADALRESGTEPERRFMHQ